MSLRRERDARRTAKSVRNWEATMAAYGNASGWKSAEEAGMSYSYNESNPDSPAVFPGRGHVNSTKDLFESGDTLTFGHRGTNKGDK